jgi:hypothetical protein
MPPLAPLLAGVHPLLALLIALAAVGLLLVPLYFLIIVPQMKKVAAAEAAKVARIELRGKPVRAWIVQAHDDLYKDGASDDSRNAQVIYTWDELPNWDQSMAAIADKLPSFRAGPNATEDEKRISTVMETQFPWYDPIRLPASVAGKLTVYTVSVSVKFKKLPEGKLTRPYIWCKVLEGESDNVRMIDYPAGEASVT